MRKAIYGCAALAVATAAGIYLVTDQAARHPDSLVGRWTAAVAEAGVALNPFSVLGRATQVPGAPVGCEPMPGPQNDGVGELVRVPKPEAGVEPAADVDAEAAPEAEAAVEPEEVIQVEEQPVAGFVQGEEVAPEPCDGDHGDGLVEETREPLPAVEPAEECEPAATTAVRMPYADEAAAEAPAEGCVTGPCGWLWELMKQLGVSMPMQDQAAPPPTHEEQGHEGDASAPGQTTTPASPEGDDPGAPQAKESEPGTQASPAHECPECEHSCPYTGCPYPHGEYTPPAIDNQPAGASKPMPKVNETMGVPFFKPFAAEEGVGASGTVVPGPLGLDTMEYRPTDGDEDAYDGLRF